MIWQFVLQFIQLSIHGKLAIGNADFIRTVHLLQDSVATAMWFKDAAAWRTRGKGSEIFRGSHRIRGQYLYVVIYENWGDLLVEIYCPVDAMFYIHLFALPQLVMLFRAHPLPLRALLACIRTNTYSQPVIDAILDRLDFNLPGTEGHWWYRKHFRLEVPSLVIRSYDDKGYRGPIYRTRQYVTQRAVMTSFYETDRGAIKVVIEGDHFGPEIFNRTSPPLSLELSPKTLRKLLASWPDRDILLPERRLDLYHILAKRLEVVEVPVESSACRKAAPATSQLASSAAEIFCDLQHFLKWASRFKVKLHLT